MTIEFTVNIICIDPDAPRAIQLNLMRKPEEDMVMDDIEDRLTFALSEMMQQEDFIKTFNLVERRKV